MPDPQNSSEPTDVVEELSTDNTASAASEDGSATDIISELRANRRPPSKPSVAPQTPLVRITVTQGSDSDDDSEPVTTTVDVNVNPSPEPEE